MVKDIENSVNFINNFALEHSQNKFEELTKAFRYLRNSCAGSYAIQEKIASDQNILHSTLNILNSLKNLHVQNDDSILCLTVGLQFIANLLVNNHGTQKQIWESYENLIKSCLRFQNIKIQNCSAMIIYNVFLGHTEFINFNDKLYEDIISLTANSETSEFPIYILQLFVSRTSFIKEVYNKLSEESKLVIIDIIKDLIQYDGLTNKEVTDFFVEKFNTYSNSILNMLQCMNTPFQAYETIRILEIITSISSSNESNLKNLQTNNELFVNCVCLLRSVHSLSKEPDNNLSMIQKISELNEIEKNQVVQEQPQFGFKSLLIRLVGNLCFKHAVNQNKLRELDGIPVLLECCNIDGRNPFITQWAILAIRNVCENNAENQKYIASMPNNGKIDVEKLEKMGIMLNKEADGSSLSICPLEIKR